MRDNEPVKKLRFVQFTKYERRRLQEYTATTAATTTTRGDAVSLLAEQRTCDSQVAGSSPGCASLRSDLG